jgi:LuxR family maltose regulon positive regulatory protein
MRPNPQFPTFSPPTSSFHLSTAWLSLDEADNDPARFFGYLIAALQTAAPHLGRAAAALLETPLSAGAYPHEAILTALINDLTTHPGQLLVVLDDYHLIESQAIHQALAFLIDHLPPGMRLALAGRADPPLPLPRLRARGQIVELRAADLRFTPDEAAAFLNQALALGLPEPEIAALEAHTEGWIAGLHLAGVALQTQLPTQGRASLSELIAAFTGSNRYILDDLADEVLRQQPEAVQSFLLQTAILSRMTGSLCNAMTGETNGQAMLEMLDKANLFVIPLDQERTWYRYHNLFAGFLRSHLRQSRFASTVQHQHRQRRSPRHKRCQDMRQIAPLLPFNGQAVFAGGERDGFTCSISLRPTVGFHRLVNGGVCPHIGGCSVRAGDQQRKGEENHEPFPCRFHGVHIL